MDANAWPDVDGAATAFLLMWLAMMVAMMLPSALPMFLRNKARRQSRCLLDGHWILRRLAGCWRGVYALGVAFAAAAMRWEPFSRAVPVLSGAALIAAGAFQFTRWKMTGLLRCRSPLGCGSVCPERETNFRLGCKQGAACCLCCTAPMMIMIMLGMMNPFVMVGIAIVIAAEKLLPRAEIVARLVGVAVIVTGITIISRNLLTAHLLTPC